MVQTETRQKVLAMIEEICDATIPEGSYETDLFAEGILDSMAAIELLLSIEDEFGIVIAPTECEREEMNSVDKIAAQIEKRL